MLITHTTNASRCGSNFNNLGCSAERKTMSIGFYVCGVSFEYQKIKTKVMRTAHSRSKSAQSTTNRPTRRKARATIRVVCVLQLISWEKGVSHCRNFLDQSQSEAIRKETKSSGGIYCLFWLTVSRIVRCFLSSPFFSRAPYAFQFN